jgi:pantetheine-phosphate adenylyltransferase
MNSVAIYPGSFDPITNGHVDLIRRGLEIFDHLIIAVARNPGKKPLFTIEERLDMIREVLSGSDDHISVETFDGLLVDYAVSKGVNVILRGLRAMSDFEYEFQLALMNRKLQRRVETLFMMTGYQWFYTSSTIIKEAASLGGSVEGLVPPSVNKRLVEKYQQINSK